MGRKESKEKCLIARERMDHLFEVPGQFMLWILEPGVHGPEKLCNGGCRVFLGEFGCDRNEFFV